MDCRNAMLLISPYIDGALSKDEEAALLHHTTCCSSCARELALEKMLSGALREIGRSEIQAPSELCSLVIGQVRAEQRGILQKLPLGTWRRAAAVAAASLLILGGSAGINAGLKIGMGSKLLGYQTALPQDNSQPDQVAYIQEGAPDNRVSQPNNIIPSSVDMGTGNTPGSNPANGSTPLNNKDNSGDNLSSAISAGRTATETAAPSTLGAPVLLSSEMKENSTILKVAVADLSAGKAKATELAAGAGAAVQVFPEQNNGNNVVYMKITIASDQASGMIAGIEGLGTLIDRQDESNDITSLYNETLVNYYDLQYRISMEKDAATKQQLATQAASCKQRLDNWETEANKLVINLWLEK